MSLRSGAFRTGRRGHVALIAGSVGAALLLLLVLAIGFGWGLARGLVERRLAARLQRPVHIAALARVGPISLNPLIEIQELRIAQPAWAGQGDMVRVRRARIRLPVLPLFVGRLRPEAIAIEGADLALVVAQDGRSNWLAPERGASGGSPVRLGNTAISDTRIRYADAKRDVRVTATLDSDVRRFALTGRGVIRGLPASVSLTGPTVAGEAPWPFRLAVRSPIVTLEVAGRTATPLDIGHLEGRATASGDDLKDLDRLIQAGLPASQHFALTAAIRHDRPDWRVSNLAGQIGRSDISGAITIRKREARSKLAGILSANRFDFDDLASDAARAEGAARRRQLGPRLIPPTRIRLDRLRRTDGRLEITIRQLLFDRPSALRSLHAVVSLDHGVLTVSPLTLALSRGRITGKAIVHHPEGAPRLSLDLALDDATLETLITRPSTATGSLRGRLRLDGEGDTVRDAIGRSHGRFALVADGKLDRRDALATAADLGRAALARPGETVPLRCLAAAFTVRGGLARADPLVMATTVGRSDGEGMVRLGDERLDLMLRGRSSTGIGLKLDAPLRVTGTIEQPAVRLPEGVASTGGILKLIGRAIGGGQPAAPPVDCAALVRRVLG